MERERWRLIIILCLIVGTLCFLGMDSTEAVDITYIAKIDTRMRGNLDCRAVAIEQILERDGIKENKEIVAQIENLNPSEVQIIVVYGAPLKKLHYSKKSHLLKPIFYNENNVDSNLYLYAIDRDIETYAIEP